MIDKIPHILGFCAVVTFLLSYQIKERKNIILVNTISRLLYIAQYVILGAFTGVVLDVLGTIVSIIAAKKETIKQKIPLKIIIVCANLLIIVIGGLFVKNVLDIMPIIGVMFQINAFWFDKEKHIRILSLSGSPFWLVYNLYNKAYGSAVGDLLSMASIIIAMIRYKKGKKLTQ